MSKYRRAAKIDKNQPEIVEQLRKIPGVTVQVAMDDILIGRNGLNYWVELKDSDCVSKKTGIILESKIKDSQKRLRAKWCGNYHICSTIEEILLIIGIEA